MPSRVLAVPMTVAPSARAICVARSEEHTSELQSRQYLVCRLLLEKKKRKITQTAPAPFERLAHLPLPHRNSTHTRPRHAARSSHDGGWRHTPTTPAIYSIT